MRTRLAVVVAIAAMTLVGCGDKSENVSHSAPHTRNANMSDEEFADYIRENIFSYSHDSTYDIVNLADTICSALDSGLSFEDLMNAMTHGIPSDNAAMVGSAVAFDCPDHRDEIFS